ncbi:MAG: WD40 repeat domain-containing protein [Planctomycetes bacterium]|nr:WD40 repeat domain-containing protein [Planctomycetota bacterium]
MRRMYTFLLGLLVTSCPANAEDKLRRDIHGDPLPKGAIARLGTIKLRPGAGVDHLAFSPDGKQLACWCGFNYSANALVIYDVATGNEVRWTPAPEMRALALSWLRNGRGLALVHVDQEENDYVMWEFTDPKASLPRREAARNGRSGYDLSQFAISPDGNWVAASGMTSRTKEQPIRIWRWHAGKKLDRASVAHKIDFGGRGCRGFHFFPDGQSLLAVCPNASTKSLDLIVVDLLKGMQREIITVPLPADDWKNECQVVVDPRSKQFALTRPGMPARLFDLATGKEHASLPSPRQEKDGRQKHIHTVAFSPDGSFLASTEYYGTLRLWDLKNNRPLWEVPDAHVKTLSFSQDGRLLATGGIEGAVHIRDAATGKELCPQPGWELVPSTLASLPDGRRAVVASRTPSLSVWDLVESKCLNQKDLTGSVWRQTLTPGGGAMVFTRDNKLQRWDLADKVEPVAWACDETVYNLSFSHDGKTLATLGDKEARVWDWPSGKLRRSWPLTELLSPGLELLSALPVSEGGSRLATVVCESHFQSWMEFWDTRTGKKVGQSPKDDGRYYRPWPTSNGVGVFAGYSTRDGRFILYDVNRGRFIRVFRSAPESRDGEFNFIHDAALAPDGRILALAGNDQSVVLFEASTGLVRRRLAGHRNDVKALAFTPDGRRLITMSRDLTGLVWDLSHPTAGLRGASPGIIEAAWHDLINTTDGALVQNALATLAANPAGFLGLCEKHLRPAAKLDHRAIDQWLADLDSSVFATRANAQKELEQLGEEIVPILKAQLGKKPSLETVRRLETMIAKLDPVDPPPDRLQKIRACEILEYIATPGARQFLKRLANGARHARLTVEARAALDRIDKLQARK